MDGHNVGFGYGRQDGKFDWEGIRLAVNFFLAHLFTTIRVILPGYRRNAFTKDSLNGQLFSELNAGGFIIFVKGEDYDDLHTINLAYRNSGVVVSRDNFTDVYFQDDFKHFRPTINGRVRFYFNRYRQFRVDNIDDIRFYILREAAPTRFSWAPEKVKKSDRNIRITEVQKQRQRRDDNNHVEFMNEIHGSALRRQLSEWKVGWVGGRVVS